MLPALQFAEHSVPEPLLPVGQRASLRGGYEVERQLVQLAVGERANVGASMYRQSQPLLD